MYEMGELKSFIQGLLCKSEDSPRKVEDNEFCGIDTGLKHDSSLTHHVSNKFIPKLDMRKFYGKDPTNWLCQMEQFFDIHHVPSQQKVSMASLYLEPDQFFWYRWLCDEKRKKGCVVTWSIFQEELSTHYGNNLMDSYFCQLTKLQQTGMVKDYIQQFQTLSLRVENVADENMMEIFLGGLQDHIKYEVRLFQPQSLSQAIVMARQVEEKFLARTRQGNINFSERISLTKPTRLTPQQIEEKRAKGLCFNCDSKYSQGHQCSEKKLFYIEGPNGEEEQY